MKYAIIGSRKPSEESVAKMLEYLNAQTDVTEIVSGGAFGADTVAGEFAMEHNLAITVYAPAGWHNAVQCNTLRKYEKGTVNNTGLGYNDRNTLIINNCDIVVCPDYGNGTIDSILKAVKQNKPVHVFGNYIPGRFRKTLPATGITFHC